FARVRYLTNCLRSQNFDDSWILRTDRDGCNDLMSSMQRRMRMNRWYHMIAWTLSVLLLESGCMLDFQQRSRSDRQGWAPLRVGVVMPLAVREATTVVRPCILPFRATIGDAIANTLQME